MILKRFKRFFRQLKRVIATIWERDSLKEQENLKRYVGKGPACTLLAAQVVA